MILAAVLLLSFFPASVKSAQDEYSVKAAFIGKIIPFIRWPNETREGRETDFLLLCLIGENPFNKRLEKVAAFSVRKKPALHIKFIQKPEHISGCNLLFISQSETRQLNAIIENTERRGVLTISDTAGFAERGVMMNLFIENESIRFEINERAIQRSPLKISFKLLRLARMIE